MIADPGHGQIGDHGVVGREMIEEIGIAAGDDDVLLCEHHAFRPPRGARRIEYDANVAALAGGNAVEPSLANGGI